MLLEGTLTGEDGAQFVGVDVTTRDDADNIALRPASAARAEATDTAPAASAIT